MSQFPQNYSSIFSALTQTKRRVFLSFDYDDVNQVNGLRLLKAHPDYELDFYDQSLRVSVNSRDADYVKSRIREKIRAASVTVCLIGQATHLSSWVDWELQASEEEGNRIITMALKGISSAILPTLIRQKCLPFHAWDPSHLNRLIQNG